MKKHFFNLIVIVILFCIVSFSCASSKGESHSGITSPDPVGHSEDTVVNTESTADSTASPVAESPGEPAGAGTAVIDGELKKEGLELGIVSAESSSYGARAAAADEEISMPMMVEEEADDYSYSAGTSPSTPAPSQSGLKAGYSDDNRQYGYFLNFLDEFAYQVTPLDLDVSERILFSVIDSDEKPVRGAEITVTGSKFSRKGVSLADGTYQFNPPSESRDESFTISVVPGEEYPGVVKTLEVDRNGPRTVTISIDSGRIIPDPIPMDIVFVMDTTGSMGEEIERLKNTIQIIHMNLTSLSVSAEVRFGMVLYKDVEDEYRTRVIPLTDDLYRFQNELNKVTALGGGDTPEDLEAALDGLIHGMEWNPDGIQLAYIITDAPPHLDYNSSYTCGDAARDGRAQGLKIYGIGTGGLDLQGEYILRQIAQYTSARYIFLTYGSETGESGGGAAGSVSHHTGSNWNADKLESIIIRFAREELSYLTNIPLTDEDPWFQADKIDTEETEETLATLFDQAVEQLLDFSTFPVTLRTPLAVLPFQADEEFGATAEYFNEHFILSAGKNDRISLAERKEIGQIMAELEFQNMGLTEEGRVGEIGALLNAEVLIAGNLFQKSGKYEIFLKLLRTETGEILSVTRAVLDPELGL